MGMQVGQAKSGWRGELGRGTSTSVEWYGRCFEFLATNCLCAFFFPKYSPYLRSFVTTLTAVSFGSLETATDDAAAVLLIKIWRVATGQE
jgi:hypothetical protein